MDSNSSTLLTVIDGISGCEATLATKPVGLALRIPPEDIASAISLEIPRSHQNGIADLDPDPALHLAANSTHSFMTICTLDHESIVTQHLGYYAKHLAFTRRDHFSEIAFAQNLFLSHTSHRNYVALLLS